MNKSILRRGMALSLTLTMALAAFPIGVRAAEEDGLCIHHPAHNEFCDKKEGQDCLFIAQNCQLCRDDVQLTAILGTDVIINGYSFPYTGKEVCPEVTVTVGGTQLTQDTHYTLTYQDNLAPGTGSVTVTGITEAGYEGIVTVSFTIEAPQYTLTEIKGTDVTIDGTTFPYTGEAVKPGITVTVNGTVLTEGTDYTLTYENNVQPGTGKVTVAGIATASQTQGYTGKVSIEFTITEKVQEPEEETKPEDTDKPGNEEETKPVSYEITKGNRATWYMGSGKLLSFTTNGADKDFTGISVNGKGLGKSYYTLKDGKVTLNTGFLNKLTVGKYSIAVHFTDGDAEGTFFVSDQLDTSNPVTGDAVHVGMWITITLSALAALGYAAFIAGRKQNK